MDCIAEIRIKRIHVAAIPCDLDGVSDGTLNARSGCLIFLGNGRVEDLCDGIYDVRVLDGQENCGAEILIALDVRGNIFALFFTEFIALFIGVNS